MTPSVTTGKPVSRVGQLRRAGVGIDLGGTTLTGVMVDREGKRLAHRTTPAEVHRGPDAVIADMVELVDALLAEASLDRQSQLADRKALIGVGVAAPGPLSRQSGRIIRSANLPGWVDVPLCDRLGEALEVPITLENDGNAAAFGEFWLGAGEDGADLVMLTLGTGVGAGVILNGQILRGHFENAAELGHMIVVHDGLPCPCGQRGCLEQYASAGAVARRAAAGLERGDSSSLAAAVKNGAPIASEAVVSAARA
ncbi:MAG: ROK family protein, partial [Planctomycetes bacterium]|nr:ROK family protein [Planctomycetota bacterium]